MRLGSPGPALLLGVREVLVSVSRACLPAVTSKMETDSVKVGVGGERVSSPADLKAFFPQYYFVG